MLVSFMFSYVGFCYVDFCYVWIKLVKIRDNARVSRNSAAYLHFLWRVERIVFNVIIGNFKEFSR